MQSLHIPISIVLILYSIFLSASIKASCNNEAAAASIYDVLKEHGLPMGLLPKGVRNFSFDDDTGKFEVHLDEACNAKFEDELHYDRNVSGILSYGKIEELSGISAQDLFLWFRVVEIRVDVPSTGLIYFDVGVVSKQFSLSSFETPRDCLAVPVPAPHLRDDGTHILEESTSKVIFGKLRHELDQDIASRYAL